MFRESVNLADSKIPIINNSVRKRVFPNI